MDPSTFKKDALAKKAEDKKVEELKSGDGGQQEEGEALGDGTAKKKRQPVDKQQAFIEYKEQGEGKNLERSIV